VGHASRSSSMLRVEDRDRIFQSGHKIGGCATVGDARGTITEVTSSPS
jgi:hypothetical protein